MLSMHSCHCICHTGQRTSLWLLVQYIKIKKCYFLNGKLWLLYIVFFCCVIFFCLAGYNFFSSVLFKYNKEIPPLPLRSKLFTVKFWIQRTKSALDDNANPLLELFLTAIFDLSINSIIFIFKKEVTIYTLVQKIYCKKVILFCFIGLSLIFKKMFSLNISFLEF